MADEYRSRQERRNKTTSNSSGSSKGTKKKKSGGGGGGKIFRRILFFGMILFLVLFAAGGIFAFSMIQGAPKLDLNQLKDPLSSKVYDMNGDVIADLGQEKRTKVSYQDIPQVVKDAFIATEDVRFYDHMGIDVKRIGGAVLANFKEGFGAEGASTITQQVVKRSFLSPDKTISRKAQEAWLSIKLEQKLEKWQILEIYLNKIYFDNRVYGVAKAAEFYFDKPLSELEVEEAALLAGIPKAPAYYDPYDHPDAAEKRRNVVIGLMAKHGKITEEQAKKAKAIPIEDTLSKGERDFSSYDAFIDQVIEEVSELEDVDIYSSGLKIYTTIDPKAQQYVEDMLYTDKHVSYPNDRFQAGLVLTDTQTGEIRAIGGGRNENAKRGYNYATDINRQPGSTAKPIFDYGPAIEYLKWSTYHQIIDERHEYSNGTPVNNWDNRYKGQMSIRKALAESRNIPALKTIQEVGLDKSREFAAGLGLDLPNDIYEAYSIGGFNGLSPLELAGAYSAFGNNGIFNKPHAVTKVEFPDGEVVDLKPEPKAAMSDYTAFMVTDMMKSVMTRGTGTAANVPRLNIAGKTGTTNFDEATQRKYGIPSKAVPDSWFAGYTPEYTAAIWTGYPKTSAENYLPYNQQQIAKQMFKQLFEHIYEGKESKDFKKPDSVVRVGIEEGTMPARLPSDYTPESRITYEYFVRGTEPNKVSKQFEEIDPVSSLNASYTAPLNRILVQWNYDKEATFEVQQSIDGGGYQTVTTTKDNYFLVNGPQEGSEYSFRVVARADGTQSPPATTSVRVGGRGDDDEKDEEDMSPGLDGDIPLPPGQEDKDKKDKKDEKDKKKDDKKRKEDEPAPDEGEQTPPDEGEQPPEDGIIIPE
ncbi:PBP1A family penicillin-binding protein [Bacillus tianshenii]|nr:PBP1A family penicillin-binding protein [Bacillus tianshenii]